MLRALFTLFIFIGGAVMGFAAAVMILPIPGKTFFNKLSQLPLNAQSLVDDSLNLSQSFLKLCKSALEEVKFKFVESSQVAERVMTAVRESKEAS